MLLAAIHLTLLTHVPTSAEDGDALRARALAIRRHLATKMIDRDRGLVATRIRGGDPLEDTSLYGGFYLGALVEAWEQTRNADTASLARRVFNRKFALNHVRIPIEAMTTVLLVGDDEQAKQVVKPLREMLEGMPVEAFHYSVPLVSLEWAYWLALKRGLLSAAVPAK